MALTGTVHNGVVVFQDDGSRLPEGTLVTVVPVSTLEVGESAAESRATDAEDKSQAGGTSEASGRIWQTLARLAREVEQEPCDLPEDLAANHDHYLYGTPNRE